MSASSEQILDTYVAYLESLSPESLGGLRKLVAEDVHFKDPFNDRRGADALHEIFADMFEKADHPRFRVTGRGVSKHEGFLHWQFSCVPRSKLAGGPLSFRGMSAISWNDEGRVSEHIDYWDAGTNVYEKLPLLGMLIRVIKRGFAP